MPDDWGFRFLVEPLRGVHFRVVRELELICRFGGRAKSGGGPSAAGTTYGPQVGIVDFPNTSRRQGFHLSRSFCGIYDVGHCVNVILAFRFKFYDGRLIRLFV